MNTLHFFDPRPFTAALVTLLVTIVAALAAASLPNIDLGSDGAQATTAPAATEPVAGGPAWVSDPLAPPSLLRR